VALERAEGEVVAFLDDDARATSGWLGALADAYEPGTAVAGGPVVLSWPGPPPRWVSPPLERWFSALDLGPYRRRLRADEELFGCNLSVRRDVALAVGGFDPTLGRVGRRLRSGEDWRLLQLVHGTGAAVAYVPEAVVVHDVLPERLRPWWLVRRAWDQGGSDATRAAARSRRLLVADAGRAARQAVGGVPGPLRASVAGRSDHAVLGGVEVVRSLGYAGESLRRALSRGRPGAGADPPDR
jgi:hypothetical protein